MVTNFNALIQEQTEWIPLSSVKSKGTFYPNIRKSGVYQISDEKVKELVHPNIGYVGMSKNIEDRIYSVKLGFYGKKSNHTVGKWLKSNGFDPDTTYYRILFSEEPLKLERALHETNKKEYGQTYKWQGAGGNQAGRDFQLQEMIKELPVETLVEDVMPALMTGLEQKLLLGWIEKKIIIRATNRE